MSPYTLIFAAIFVLCFLTISGNCCGNKYHLSTSVYDKNGGVITKSVDNNGRVTITRIKGEEGTDVENSEEKDGIVTTKRPVGSAPIKKGKYATHVKIISSI